MVPYCSELVTKSIITLKTRFSEELTAWSWFLLEKPPVTQPLKNFQTFYGTRWFITVFSGAFHWPVSWARSIQSVPLHFISLISNLILPYILPERALPPNPIFHFLPYVPNATPISFPLTSSFCLYLANSTSYEAPNNAVFSTLLSLHLSSVQIYSSAPCLQTPSVYVPGIFTRNWWAIVIIRNMDNK
jgi:hypothetical protein